MDENTPVDTTFYSENGEWDFLSSSGHTPSSQVRGGTWYSTLSFSITLRRKPVYHALNTLFPVILMTFLIPMVYKLPTESGEKMSYSLTVLLAYAVYLSLISDNIPSTSKSVCLLCKYSEQLTEISDNFFISEYKVIILLFFFRSAISWSDPGF